MISWWVAAIDLNCHGRSVNGRYHYSGVISLVAVLFVLRRRQTPLPGRT